MSEPLSSDLNVNFVCLSVCHGPTAYHKSLLALTYFAHFHPALVEKSLKRDEDMNHGQSNSSMATARTETTRGITYSVARAIEVTAWQSVDAICLCCLTHSACVKVTGLQPLLTTA